MVRNLREFCGELSEGKIGVQLSPPHGQLLWKGTDLPFCSCMLPGSPFAQVLKLIQILGGQFRGAKPAENVCLCSLDQYIVSSPAKGKRWC